MGSRGRIDGVLLVSHRTRALTGMEPRRHRPSQSSGGTGQERLPTTTRGSGRGFSRGGVPLAVDDPPPPSPLPRCMLTHLVELEPAHLSPVPILARRPRSLALPPPPPPPPSSCPSCIAGMLVGLTPWGKTLLLSKNAPLYPVLDALKVRGHRTGSGSRRCRERGVSLPGNFRTAFSIRRIFRAFRGRGSGS